MPRIRLSSRYSQVEYERQAPGRQPRWGDYEFVINRAVDECDYWVVCEGLSAVEQCVCPPGNTVFVTWEPPEISGYDPQFLAQFATVVTCERSDLHHPNVVRSQQFLPWWVGQRRVGGEVTYPLDYDFFAALQPMQKTRCLSIITSAKKMCDGHAKRFEFTRTLKEHFKDKLDWYGQGVWEIADKWEAIAPYRYHICIENSAIRHYWTEKLSDPLLGWAMPLYYGCPNVADYFSPDGHVPIDLNQPDQAIERIEQVIEEDPYERSLPAIRAARDLVLNRYNLFPAVVEICRNLEAIGGGGMKKRIVLKHQFDTIATRVMRRLGGGRAGGRR